MNKAVRERREFLLQFQVCTKVGSDRRPPPSTAVALPPSSPADFSGETRVQTASKSAIHPWNLRRRRTPHAPLLPRTFSGACSSRAAVPASEAAPSDLGSFVVASWVRFRPHLLLSASRLVNSYVLGFAVWLLNGLLWTCFLRDPNHHHCKAELEKLPFVVCFRGVVVPWSRTP